MSQTDGATIPASSAGGRRKVRVVDGIPVPVPPEGRDWMTIREVADALEVPEKRVREWTSIGVSVGEIGSRRRVMLARVSLGKAIRIYPEAVHTFLKIRSLPPCQASASASAPVEGDEQKSARLAAAEAELVAMGMLP